MRKLLLIIIQLICKSHFPYAANVLVLLWTIMSLRCSDVYVYVRCSDVYVAILSCDHSHDDSVDFSFLICGIQTNSPTDWFYVVFILLVGLDF